MTSKEHDEKLLKWREIFEILNIPFYLNQSTLLGLYRDGKHFDGNRSLDLGVIGDDLTTEVLNELILTGHKFSENSHEAKRGLMYFEDSYVEIQPVSFKNGKAIYNLTNAQCLWWPEEYLKRENWGKLTYMDLEWNIPGQTDKYLAHYYGEDWKTPKKNWGWTQEAKNQIKYQDL